MANKTGTDLLREMRERMGIEDQDFDKQFANMANTVSKAVRGQTRRMAGWMILAVLTQVVLYGGGVVAVIVAACWAVKHFLLS